MLAIVESELAVNFAVKKDIRRTISCSSLHRALSTQAEARVLVPELRRLGVHSFLLVTSDYHTRRAGHYFRQLADGLDMRVIAAPMSISAGTPGGVTARRRRSSMEWSTWPVCSDCEKTSLLKTLRPLWPYLWRYRSAFLLGLSALALNDLAAVSAPLIIRGAVDRFTQGAPAAQIWRFAAYLVGVAILRGIFQYWMRVVLIGISRDIEYDLRNDLFRHLVSLSADFYARNRTGDIMARATNDLNAVRMMLGPGVMYWTETSLTFVLAIAVMA
jgi:hypothetical protein